MTGTPACDQSVSQVYSSILILICNGPCFSLVLRQGPLSYPAVEWVVPGAGVFVCKEKLRRLGSEPPELYRMSVNGLLLDPADEREVLTVGQVRVRRIETIRVAEHTRIAEFVFKLVGYGVAFLGYNFERH